MQNRLPDSPFQGSSCLVPVGRDEIRALLKRPAWEAILQLLFPLLQIHTGRALIAKLQAPVVQKEDNRYYPPGKSLSTG